MVGPARINEKADELCARPDIFIPGVIGVSLGPLVTFSYLNQDNNLSQIPFAHAAEAHQSPAQAAGLSSVETIGIIGGAELGSAVVAITVVQGIRKAINSIRNRHVAQS